MPTDEWQNEMNGAVPLVVPTQYSGGSRQDVVPEQLIGGGDHFDDIGANTRYNRQRRYNYWIERNEGMMLPRDEMHSFVASIGLTRPTPLPI
jgi:hypothetical protein